ncbi:MAG TPA: helix-turn-helix transcriptional regulator [Candidatus Limnocylindrales bacterium]|nr:helix-turn-helix transcriptional regulator [Candidatus Limnocylindrales bacterium]
MDAIRLGLQLRSLRIRARLRQADLAAVARVPRDCVSELERGVVSHASLAAVERVSAALGGSIDVRLRWRGESLDRLLDEAHAATVGAVVERLDRAGWDCRVEASFSIWGERGSIDVLGWHPSTRSLLVVEVKSVVPDVQAMLHGLDRKARLAGEVAAGFGWSPATVGRLLAVAESPTSRGRVRLAGVVLDAALPDRGPAVRRWIVAPAGTLAGLLFLSNAAHSSTRRPVWRRQRVRPPSGSRPRPRAAVDKNSAR